MFIFIFEVDQLSRLFVSLDIPIIKKNLQTLKTLWWEPWSSG